VADGSNRIREVLANGFIVTIAGSGTRGYSGDGGAGTFAQLSGPTAVAVDASGNVYVADSGNDAVRLLQPSAGALTISAVTNGATYKTGAIAPGEVVVIYGSGMGPAQLTQFQLNSAGLVPTNVAGTTVYFNGTPAPVLYTSANQVSAIVPFSISGSTAQVVVQYQGQVSPSLSVAVAPTAPSLFTLNGSGSGQALAITRDGSINDSAHTVKAGDLITLYATGLGQTNPASQDGQPATVPLPLPVASVSATIGGKSATVQYAGAAPRTVAGVMQINVFVPSGLTSGDVSVTIQADAAASQNDVTIAVE
jgi:uncharacterized protein (TIGR03437 family)